MIPQKRIGVGVVLLVLLIGLTLLFARVGSGRRWSMAHLHREAAHTTAYNCDKVDSGVSLLKSGYIVLRMGKGADSYMLSQFNRKDKSYSHCGIVLIEDGYPFVYHAIGGEDNPDERLRRDSASFFFSPEHNFAIAVVSYSFDSTRISKLREVVQYYYKAKPKFDLKFDLNTDDKLYCAEFVYKTINKAMQDDNFIGTTTTMGVRYAGVDNLFLNPHCKIIWQTKFK